VASVPVLNSPAKNKELRRGEDSFFQGLETGFGDASTAKKSEE